MFNFSSFWSTANISFYFAKSMQSISSSLPPALFGLKPAISPLLRFWKQDEKLQVRMTVLILQVFKCDSSIFSIRLSRSAKWNNTMFPSSCLSFTDPWDKFLFINERPRTITFEYSSIAAWETNEMSSTRTRWCAVGLALTDTQSEKGSSSGSWRGKWLAWLSVGTNTG